MKRVLIAVVLLVAIGAGVAYFMMNKPHKDIADVKTEKVSATQLAADFEADEAAATAKYLNKALSMTGIPTEISQNQDGQTVVFFSEDGITGVQATLKDKGQAILAGKEVTINGFCNGYSMVVLLSDCVLRK